MVPPTKCHGLKQREEEMKGQVNSWGANVSSSTSSFSSVDDYSFSNVQRRLFDLWSNSTSAEVKAAANSWLLSFQTQREAWYIARELLLTSEVQLQIVGAQTLSWKTTHQPQDLSFEDKQQLVGFIIQFFQQQQQNSDEQIRKEREGLSSFHNYEVKNRTTSVGGGEWWRGTLLLPPVVIVRLSECVATCIVHCLQSNQWTTALSDIHRIARISSSSTPPPIPSSSSSSSSSSVSSSFSTTNTNTTHPSSTGNSTTTTSQCNGSSSSPLSVMRYVGLQIFASIPNANISLNLPSLGILKCRESRSALICGECLGELLEFLAETFEICKDEMMMRTHNSYNINLCLEEGGGEGGGMSKKFWEVGLSCVIAWMTFHELPLLQHERLARSLCDLSPVCYESIPFTDLVIAALPRMSSYMQVWETPLPIQKSNNNCNNNSNSSSGMGEGTTCGSFASVVAASWRSCRLPKDGGEGIFLGSILQHLQLLFEQLLPLCRSTSTNNVDVTTTTDNLQPQALQQTNRSSSALAIAAIAASPSLPSSSSSSSSSNSSSLLISSRVSPSSSLSTTMSTSSLSSLHSLATFQLLVDEDAAFASFWAPPVSLIETGNRLATLTRWSEILLALVEGYPQVLFDPQFSFFPQLIKCFFVVHPKVWEATVGIWPTMKEMRREKLMPDSMLLSLLNSVGLCCVKSLLINSNRNAEGWKDCEEEEWEHHLEVAGDVVCDLFFLYDGVSYLASEEFVLFVGVALEQMILLGDVYSIEILLNVGDALAEAISSGLSDVLFSLLLSLRNLPDDKRCAVAAVRFLEKVAVHFSASDGRASSFSSSSSSLASSASSAPALAGVDGRGVGGEEVVEERRRQSRRCSAWVVCVQVVMRCLRWTPIHASQALYELCSWGSQNILYLHLIDGSSNSLGSGGGGGSGSGGQQQLQPSSSSSTSSNQTNCHHQDIGNISSSIPFPSSPSASSPLDSPSLAASSSSVLSPRASAGRYLQEFLSFVESTAVHQTPLVDATLHAAAIKLAVRLPLSELPEAFCFCLKSTATTFLDLVINNQMYMNESESSRTSSHQRNNGGGGERRLPLPRLMKQLLFRCLFRMQRCAIALDIPPPPSSSVSSSFGPTWPLPSHRLHEEDGRRLTSWSRTIASAFRGNSNVGVESEAMEELLVSTKLRCWTKLLLSYTNHTSGGVSSLSTLTSVNFSPPPSSSSTSAPHISSRFAMCDLSASSSLWQCLSKLFFFLFTHKFYSSTSFCEALNSSLSNGRLDSKTPRPKKPLCLSTFMRWQQKKKTQSYGEFTEGDDDAHSDLMLLGTALEFLRTLVDGMTISKKIETSSSSSSTTTAAFLSAPSQSSSSGGEGGGRGGEEIRQREKNEEIVDMWRESIVEFVIDILKFPPSISSSSSPSSPSLQADAFSSSFYNVDDVFATTTKGGRGGGEGGGEGRISSSLAAAAQGFSTGAVTLLLADLILATITSSAPSKVTLLYNYLGHQFDSTIFPFWIKIASYVSVEHYSVLSPFYEFMFAHLRSAGRNQQNVSSAQWNFYNSVGFTPTFRLATRLIACGDKRMTKVIFQTLHSISSIRNRELRERVRPLIPEAVENVFAYMHLCGLAVATQLWRVVNCWSENFSEEFFATCQNCAEASSRESVRLREEEKEGNTKTGESSSSLPSKCFWIALTDPHRQLVLRCFQQIHGPRILQLLHDLCNIANGDMSADCLVTYELALQSSTTPSSSNSSSSTFLTSGNTYDTRNRNCAAINQEVEEIL